MLDQCSCKLHVDFGLGLCIVGTQTVILTQAQQREDLVSWVGACHVSTSASTDSVEQRALPLAVGRLVLSSGQ